MRVFEKHEQGTLALNLLSMIEAIFFTELQEHLHNFIVRDTE